MEIVSNKIYYISSSDLKKLSKFELWNLEKAYNYVCYDIDFFKLYSKIYHMKSSQILNDNLVNELIGQIITSYFNDNIIKSKLFVGEDKVHYLLTENFIKIGKKYTSVPDDIFYKFKYYVTRLDILVLDDLDVLYDSYRYKFDTYDLKRLKYDLKVMIVIDYIMGQIDRDYRNFMFEYSKNHIKLCPLYDFEYSFMIGEKNIQYKCNSFDFDLDNEEIVKYIRSDEDFQKIISIAMSLKFKNVLEQLYDEYGIIFNEDEKNKYNKVIAKKQEDIKKYKLLR